MQQQANVKEIFLLGGPNIGKGTRAKIFGETYDASILEMSALLDGGLPDGNFVEDDIVLKLWRKETGLGDERILIPGLCVHDGIPRTEPQSAGVLESISVSDLFGSTVFWDMNMNDDQMAGRFWNRYWENKAAGTLRPDESDDPEVAEKTFKHRLSIYRDNHHGILESLKASGARVFESHLTDDPGADVSAFAEFVGWGVPVGSV